MNPQTMNVPVWLRRWLIFAFVFYYWGFYIFPTQGAHKTSFYLVVVIPVALALVLAGAGMRAWWRVCFPVVLALAYLWLSVLWGETAGMAALVQFGKPLLGIILLLALAVFFRTYAPPSAMRWVWHGVLLLSMGGGILLLSRDNVIQQALADRLSGLGAWHNAIQLGYVHGLAVLIALYLFLTTARTRASWLYLLPIVLGVTLILLSKSRGPLIALSLCAFLIVWRYAAWQWAVVMLGVSLLALAGLTFTPMGEHLYSRLTDSSFRPAIWHSAWDAFCHSPVIGLGLHYPLKIVTPEGVFDHSHNLLLDILRFGGLIGLGLFLWAVALTSLRAWRLGTEQTRFWVILLGFGFVCILTDGKVPLQGPNNFWLLLWIPMGILLADTARARSGMAPVTSSSE